MTTPDLLTHSYQHAYKLYHGKEAPKITRGSGGGYVIHGEGGPSRRLPTAHMRVLTNALKRWVAEREAA
jgi:hypothetical protein